jgi:hypothetical protein
VSFKRNFILFKLMANELLWIFVLIKGDHPLNENSPLITQGGYCTDYLMSDTTAIALDSRQEDLLNGPSLPAQSSFLIGENPGN